LTDTGFDASILSEFRTRLVQGEIEAFALDRLLEHCQARDLLRAGGEQRTDSTHVLGAVRQVNRLELLGETLRAALNELAQEEGAWLQSITPPAWFERYAHRVEECRLPRSKSGRQAYLQELAHDGYALLDALERHPRGHALKSLPGVALLRQVWDQQCQRGARGIRAREIDEQPPGATRLQSPY